MTLFLYTDTGRFVGTGTAIFSLPSLRILEIV